MPIRTQEAPNGLFHACHANSIQPRGPWQQGEFRRLVAFFEKVPTSARGLCKPCRQVARWGTHQRRPPPTLRRSGLHEGAALVEKGGTRNVVLGPAQRSPRHCRLHVQEPAVQPVRQGERRLRTRDASEDDEAETATGVDLYFGDLAACALEVAPQLVPGGLAWDSSNEQLAFASFRLLAAATLRCDVRITRRPCAVKARGSVGRRGNEPAGRAEAPSIDRPMPIVHGGRRARRHRRRRHRPARNTGPQVRDAHQCRRRRAERSWSHGGTPIERHLLARALAGLAWAPKWCARISGGADGRPSSVAEECLSEVQRQEFWRSDGGGIASTQRMDRRRDKRRPATGNGAKAPEVGGPTPIINGRLCAQQRLVHRRRQAPASVADRGYLLQ
mmetsp:Transcript_42057/g.122000  ORF Transcript_42057/g.122000 Transcript_42057/m.122000 type:complete len:388 (-) Transcript_42057:585-1748(-)